MTASATVISALPRIAVIGDGGVGKSALVIQFLDSKFVTEYDPTIEECYRRSLTIDGKAHTLEIVDTAGQEDYQLLLVKHMQKSHGFVCVYACTAKLGFSKVEDYHKQILQIKEITAEVGIPFVIAGNKYDLAEAGHRQVSTQEGTELAQKLKCSFFECSAMTKFNVREVFHQTIRDTLRSFNGGGGSGAVTASSSTTTPSGTPASPSASTTTTRNGQQSGGFWKCALL